MITLFVCWRVWRQHVEDKEAGTQWLATVMPLPKPTGVGGYLPSCLTVLEFPTWCCVPLLALRNLLRRAPSSSLLSSELEPPVPVSVPVGGLAAGSPGQETFSSRHSCLWGSFRLSLKKAEAMHSAAALSQAQRSFSHRLWPMPEREVSQLLLESC